MRTIIRLLKLGHSEKATKIWNNLPLFFWHYKKKMEDYFKFLWPSQNIWILHLQRLAKGHGTIQRHHLLEIVLFSSKRSYMYISAKLSTFLNIKYVAKSCWKWYKVLENLNSLRILIKVLILRRPPKFGTIFFSVLRLLSNFCRHLRKPEL